MKKIFCALVVFCGSFVFGQNTYNTSNQFHGYVFYNIGIGRPSKGEIYESAYSFQATIGRQFMPFLAMTVNYYGKFFSSDKALDVGDDGSVEVMDPEKRVDAYYLNLEFNNFLPIIDFVEPYIGVGYGVQKIRVLSGETNAYTIEDETKLVQVYVGVRFKLNKNKAIFGEYRFYRERDEVELALDNKEEEEKLLDALVEEKDDALLFGFHYSF